MVEVQQLKTSKAFTVTNGVAHHHQYALENGDERKTKINFMLQFKEKIKKTGITHMRTLFTIAPKCTKASVNLALSSRAAMCNGVQPEWSLLFNNF
uniref:Uncharacterized protein n=1 Tax=Romanomermis culicivorax TaxID=13658 RepID=A0A915KHC2_ROMCU